MKLKSLIFILALLSLLLFAGCQQEQQGQKCTGDCPTDAGSGGVTSTSSPSKEQIENSILIQDSNLNLVLL